MILTLLSICDPVKQPVSVRYLYTCIRLVKRHGVNQDSMPISKKNILGSLSTRNPKLLPPLSLNHSVMTGNKDVPIIIPQLFYLFDHLANAYLLNSQILIIHNKDKYLPLSVEYIQWLPELIHRFTIWWMGHHFPKQNTKTEVQFVVLLLPPNRRDTDWANGQRSGRATWLYIITMITCAAHTFGLSVRIRVWYARCVWIERRTHVSEWQEQILELISILLFWDAFISKFT